MTALPPADSARVLRVDHDLASFKVVTESATVEAELRERLEPYLAVTRVRDEQLGLDGQSDFTVFAVVDTVTRPKHLAREVMIRDHLQFEKYRRPADLWEHANGWTLFERKNGSLFTWSKHPPAEVTVSNLDASSLAKSVRRLIQDILRLRVWSDGGLIVEASTVQLGSTGVLAVGGSGIGKTTFLARLLSEAGAGMVSNDEVAIVRRDGALVAFGLPMLVNVRPPLLNSFPGLTTVADFLPGEDPKAPVKYTDFAAALGGTVAAKAGPLVGILLSPDDAPAERVSEANLASSLEQNILSGPGYAGLGWRSPWQLLPPGYVELDSDDIRVRTRALASGVPVIRVGRMRSVAYIVGAVETALEQLPASKTTKDRWA